MAIGSMRYVESRTEVSSHFVFSVLTSTKWTGLREEASASFLRYQLHPMQKLGLIDP